ncbi:antibiotic biosynthesis monooxygenase family protein [Rhodobaculum claviforme]|uniref:ABM domain-containing protein n=1 Tax=Rhodobaculum claviforme TaxID=1549854 RepID=A0A934WFB7_9RHOB|nr:antibiotic biosynthesis monooxygenase family protein [Rhodobaculum claviforme]MBK5926610.1 hypothetical protein [Rhodobaculum claviforme]
MHALFFEMRPKPGHLAHYFDHVARLRPLLARHTGLWWLHRFEALDDPGLILSHQHWADEDAILGWRRDPDHRHAQEAGRRVHFADYRIRVGTEVTDADAPGARAVLTVLADAPAPALADQRAARAYRSLTDDGVVLTLIEAADSARARAMLPAVAATPGLRAAHAFAITRDYGLTDRAAAPQ